jgi:uncharacterized membrane protein
MSALQACLQLYAASRRRGRKLLFDVRPNAFHLFFAEGAHGLLQVCICAENQDENGLASKLRTPKVFASKSLRPPRRAG